MPDPDAQKAAEEIKHLASELTEKDLLIVLISGTNGTSWLLLKIIKQNWFTDIIKNINLNSVLFI